MVFAFLVLLAISVKAEKKLTGSWALCTGEDATECPMGKYANITTEIFPNPIPVGSNFTVIATGYSLKTINDPSISMRVVDGTLIDTTIRDDGCNPHKYIFPLNDGILYYDGTTCPITDGSLNITFTADVSSLGWDNPDGTGVITFKLYDEPNQKGNCVICTVTTLKMTGK